MLSFAGDRNKVLELIITLLDRDYTDSYQFSPDFGRKTVFSKRFRAAVPSNSDS